MPALSYAYPVDTIRAAEEPLLAAQTEEDQLMRSAAHAVAIAAQTMLATRPVEPGRERVLLLVGAGGNGGDALYAGASLAATGYPVDAVLMDAQDRHHEGAHEAFLYNGGIMLAGFPVDNVHDYRLVIDGILGLGGSGGVPESTAHQLEALSRTQAAVLSVDVPSGIDADSGALPEPHADGPQHSVPAHVRADVTITFGGMRYAHTLTTACGEVVLTDIGFDGRTLSGELQRLSSSDDARTLVFASRALPYDSGYEWPTSFQTPGPEPVTSIEPGPGDNKYSGGVVGVLAGSGAYPGAALLSVKGALRATSSMVRYVGDQALEVVRKHPEIIATETLADAGRVQAWVVGPGRGTDQAAHDELAELLGREEAVLIDADAVTLLAESAQLRTALVQREGPSVLTPHAGEFKRLAQAIDAGLPDSVEDPINAAAGLVRALGCALILKGRSTIVAYPSGKSVALTVIDAGSSWAATAGSGDVLSGVAGAWLAFGVAKTGSAEHGPMPHSAYYSLAPAVQIHSVATWLSAQTPDGPAPTTASRIAKYVPRATARVTWMD